MISIIIPTYNEEEMLSSKQSHFKNLCQKAELIFVDGGSSDCSCEIAAKLGQVLTAEKGRACQMNYGAGFARNEILLFLHADNMISETALVSIVQALTQRGFIGGCLTQRIENKAIIYRLIELQGNIRALLTKEFYGDQGIFIKKDVFFGLGGFPEVPIMEDVLLTKSLLRLGKTVVLPEKIIVSARRWQKKGIIKTTLLYNYIMLLFRLGFPLEKIKLLYDDLR